MYSDEDVNYDEKDDSFSGDSFSDEEVTVNYDECLAKVDEVLAGIEKVIAASRGGDWTGYKEWMEEYNRAFNICFKYDLFRNPLLFDEVVTKIVNFSKDKTSSQRNSIWRIWAYLLRLIPLESKYRNNNTFMN